MAGAVKVAESLSQFRDIPLPLMEEEGIGPITRGKYLRDFTVRSAECQTNEKQIRMSAMADFLSHEKNN